MVETMNEKLLEQRGALDPLKKTDSQFPLRGRRLAIPDELTEDELKTLTPDEINARIVKHGAALGYAALIRMAAGHGEVSQGAQARAAEFLVTHAAELAAKAKSEANDLSIMQGMNRDDLVALIADLKARKAAAEPLSE